MDGSMPVHPCKQLEAHMDRRVSDGFIDAEGSAYIYSKNKIKLGI